MLSTTKYEDSPANVVKSSVTGALLRVWQHSRIASAVALGTDWGIACESFCRRIVGLPGSGAVRPLVHWHEGGSGTPLVLVNGFTGSGLTWPTEWVQRLERTHRVIRIDNRGTGWSRTAPTPFTIADMADDVHDVLRVCGISRAVVFGLSMGGAIAMELALRHPEQVERLVLTATIPPSPAWVPTAYGIGLAASLSLPAGKDVPEPSAAQLTHVGRELLNFAAAGFEPGEGFIEEIGAQTLTRATSRRGAFMQARAINAWRSPARLAGITAPVVVAHGAADRVVPIENARRLCRLIPHAHLEILPGVGHLVPWEASDALFDIITRESDTVGARVS